MRVECDDGRLCPGSPAANHVQVDLLRCPCPPEVAAANAMPSLARAASRRASALSRRSRTRPWAWTQMPSKDIMCGDAQCPTRQTGIACNTVFGGLDRRTDSLTVLVKATAFLRQVDRTGGTVQKTRSITSLELCNRLSSRRAGQSERLAASNEISGFDN